MRYAWLPTASFAWFAAVTLAWTATGQAADQPNFVFILTDDQEPQSLGAYGNSVCSTPNIDRLAREGMQILDAHHMGSWLGAVCLPSRTMLMTGRQLWNIPGPNPVTPPPRLDPESVAENSLAAVFNRAGYVTFRTCKRGNTFHAADQHFDIRFDQQDHREPQGSNWHGQRAIDFLQDYQDEGTEAPFLLFLGFSHPHDPRNGRDELLDKYGAINAKQPVEEVSPKAPPVPLSYLSEHPFFHGHPRLRDEISVQGVRRSRAPATIRNETGRHYACIENIDDEVGRVLGKLESMGQLENTYVFFTADHGIAMGRHGLMGKQNLYEHSWRVPFLVRGPGIESGSSASGFIYLMDVLPTLGDLAGIEVPETVDGISFRDVLEGRSERVRDVVYGVYCGGTKPGIRSVKTADGWKLIKYDVMDGAVQTTQLFDLRDNPLELLEQHADPAIVDITGNVPESNQRNLAYDRRHAARLASLELLLLEQQKNWGDPFRLWDQPHE